MFWSLLDVRDSTFVHVNLLICLLGLRIYYRLQYQYEICDDEHEDFVGWNEEISTR